MHVCGVRLRAHGIFAPLTVGAVLLAGWTFVTRAALDHSRAIAHVAPWLAFALGTVTAIDALLYGSFTAAGADSYGYVSQAYGWATGQLPRPLPLMLSLPFATGDWIQTPLGYVPGPVAHTIVPSYSPGLPLLMAGGIRIAGTIGPYLIVPLSAGLFIWVAFVLARRIAGQAAGVAAALLAATSPTVLFLSLWPMSDVPAAAAWTGAAAAAVNDTRRGAWIAGVCAALAILIRPNIFPLALLPLAWIVLTCDGRERRIRAAIYSAWVVPAALAIGVLNAAWYGSPLMSGYGSPAILYSLRNVPANLQRYPLWLSQSQSPFVVIALLSLAAPAGRMRAAVALAWAFVLVTLFCYLVYVPWDEWWYLRFLLSGFGAMFALIAVSLSIVAERLPRPWGPAAAVILLAVLVWRSAAFTGAFDMFGPFKASEHRYADVGAFIARRLPANAVVFAWQHSGTIRYYGGRYTLRYDLLDAPAAPRVVSDLERLGLHPYLAIDDAERPAAQRSFRLPDNGPLPWPYVARLDRAGGVSIYDLATHPSAAAPVAIETGLAPAYSAPRQITLRARQ
jgi:hypothetical protein